MFTLDLRGLDVYHGNFTGLKFSLGVIVYTGN